MAKDIEKELLDLKKRFWRSMKDKDVDAALQLTAAPCIVTGAQGVSTIDKKAFTKLMSTAKWTLRIFEFEDVQVQQPSDDVAIIGYKVHEDIRSEERRVGKECRL